MKVTGEAAPATKHGNDNDGLPSVSQQTLNWQASGKQEPLGVDRDALTYPLLPVAPAPSLPLLPLARAR